MTEKGAMGSVADRIARKIAAQGRSKIIDLAAWREGERMRLREVGTREITTCHVPTGYAGRPGQIWFVRLLPPLPSLLPVPSLLPPGGSCGHPVVFTSPYVIEDHPEQAFVDYLQRELARMEANKPPKTDDRHGHLMKYGPDPDHWPDHWPNHWNEYIFCAYARYQHEAVFLTGIPDIRESLPHAAENKLD